MALSTDFAFEGFRIIRERPKLIAFWGMVILFGNGLSTLLVVAMAGQALTSIQTMGTQKIDPSLLATLLEQAMPALVIGTLLNTLTSSVITAAICRVALGEEDDRMGFLKFGMREVQLTVIGLVLLVMSIVVAVVTLMVAGLASAIVPGDDIGQKFFLGLGFVVAGGVIVWLRLRLSLNCVQSFDEKRLDLFGSFALTRGIFRPLLAGYVISTVMGLIVLLLCFKVIDAVLTLGFGGIPVPDSNTLSAFMTPPTIVYMIMVYGVTSPLVTAIWLGAPAAAYRTLRSDRR